MRLLQSGVLFLLVALPVAGQLPTTRTVHRTEPGAQMLFELGVARGEFSEAIEEFRKDFWLEKNRKKIAKRMEQKVNVFLRYLKFASTERPTFEPGELAALTNAQIAAEALSLAQRLRPELRKMAREERSAVVSISHWGFLYKLESDLLRLKWMTGRLR